MTLTEAAIKIEAEIGREENVVFRAVTGAGMDEVTPAEAESWGWVREIRTRHRTLRRLIAYAERDQGDAATDMLTIVTQLWDWK